MKTLAVIGTGNMGGAIVRAVCRSTEPSEVCIANRTPEKARTLAEECGCVMSQSSAAAARGAKYVLLGVKPGDVPAVLEELSPVLTGEQVVVSMASGVTAQDISRALGRDTRVVRVLPNTPCAVGRGIMLIVPCFEMGGEMADELCDLFSGCGLVGFTDEAHADAGMVIEGCTPAFAYMFIEALADGAVQTGLTREQATRWAAQAVAGAAAMVLETGSHPGRLKDEVCSPGGVTIEGVRVLERRGFRGAVTDAVVRAHECSVGKG